MPRRNPSVRDPGTSPRLAQRRGEVVTAELTHRNATGWPVRQILGFAVPEMGNRDDVPRGDQAGARKARQPKRRAALGRPFALTDRRSPRLVLPAWRVATTTWSSGPALPAARSPTG